MKQATLVSYYGEKPEKLAAYLKHFQQELINSLSSAFTPYPVEQVHATIIGLEGCRRNGCIENSNFINLRQESRQVDPAQLLAFLSSPSIPSFDVQIGGYDESHDYGFLSQGRHPCLRSFSIQGVIAVAMGWPNDRSTVLDDFRRSFRQINILHKWHKKDSDIDNDFFFVLGRVNRSSVTDDGIASAEKNIRQFMANADPIIINVNPSTLSIVCYSDTQLPLSSSRMYAIDDCHLTPDDILRCYEER